MMLGCGLAMLRDLDIRNAVHQHLMAEYRDDPCTIIVHELGILGGATRADIAVVNGHLSAFEIKSARDTLSRLPRQVELYELVFDYTTLVVSESHLGSIKSIIPGTWGIMVATPGRENDVELSLHRSCQENTDVDPRAVVELLWRDEALSFLEEIGCDRGVRNKPRWAIWDRVCSVYTLSQIRERVRRCLKERSNWRAVQQPM